MSVSCVTIAMKTNDKAIMALSSFIHALYELESYAVARLVTKANREPVVVLLAPSIESDYECLLDVQLPFAEDIRSYKFPPLDRVITISGKEIRVHRNLPNEKLQTAMSEYVDSMDLSTVGEDEEGSVSNVAGMNQKAEHIQESSRICTNERHVFASSSPNRPSRAMASNPSQRTHSSPL